MKGKLERVENGVPSGTGPAPGGDSPDGVGGRLGGAPPVIDEEARIAAMMQQKIAKKGKQLPDDDQARVGYPHLWAWLTFQRDGQGNEKDTANITIKLDDGEWRVSLIDSALERSMSAFAVTLSGALDALERVLANPEARWSVWQESGGKLRPKRRRQED